MTNITSTKQCIDLIQALEKRNIKVIPEYWDGHKHVDIYIPENEMYIEIEGYSTLLIQNKLFPILKEIIIQTLGIISLLGFQIS
jgi:hypothetical protein